jgi:hypothetical protein
MKKILLVCAKNTDKDGRAEAVVKYGGSEKVFVNE